MASGANSPPSVRHGRAAASDDASLAEVTPPDPPSSRKQLGGGGGGGSALSVVNTTPLEDDYISPEWPSVHHGLGLSPKSTRKSPSMSLSPLSSRFAEEAIEENMRRVEQECRGLSEAVNYLRKGSRKWTVVKSKLDVANDELACMLEDYEMYRNFAGGVVGNDDGATTSQDGGTSSPSRACPTPPVGSSAGRRPSTKPATPSPSAIPTLPLGRGGPGGCPPSCRDRVVGSALSSPDSSSSSAPDRAGSAQVETSRSRLGASAKGGRGRDDVADDDDRQRIMDPGDLATMLGGVQKFSIEWFTIKSAMKKLALEEEEKHGGGGGRKIMDEGDSRIVMHEYDSLKRSVISTSNMQGPCDSGGDDGVDMPTLVGRIDQTRQQRQGHLQQIVPISESKNDGGGASNKGRDISGRASACPERSTEEGKHAAGAREHPQPSAATDPDLAPLDGVPKYSLEWFHIKREIEASWESTWRDANANRRGRARPPCDGESISCYIRPRRHP